MEDVGQDGVTRTQSQTWFCPGLTDFIFFFLFKNLHVLLVRPPDHKNSAYRATGEQLLVGAQFRLNVEEEREGRRRRRWEKNLFSWLPSAGLGFTDMK